MQEGVQAHQQKQHSRARCASSSSTSHLRLGTPGRGGLGRTRVRNGRTPPWLSGAQSSVRCEQLRQQTAQEAACRKLLPGSCLHTSLRCERRAPHAAWPAPPLSPASSPPLSQALLLVTPSRRPGLLLKRHAAGSAPCCLGSPSALCSPGRGSAGLAVAEGRPPGSAGYGGGPRAPGGGRRGRLPLQPVAQPGPSWHGRRRAGSCCLADAAAAAGGSGAAGGRLRGARSEGRAAILSMQPSPPRRWLLSRRKRGRPSSGSSCSCSCGSPSGSWPSSAAAAWTLPAASLCGRTPSTLWLSGSLRPSGWTRKRSCGAQRRRRRRLP